MQRLRWSQAATEATAPRNKKSALGRFFVEKSHLSASLGMRSAMTFGADHMLFHFGLA